MSGVATSADTITLPGSFLYDTGAVSYSGPNGFKILEREVVFQESLAANPLGGLTFVYQVEYTGTGKDLSRLASDSYDNAISPMSVGSAAGTASNSLLGAAGTKDVTAWDWSADKTTFGMTFTPTLQPAGTYSYLMIVRTSNTQAVAATVSGIDGGTGNLSIAGYAPSGPNINSVPEPSSLAIAGLGALGMIGYGVRRRKALGA